MGPDNKKSIFFLHFPDQSGKSFIESVVLETIRCYPFYAMSEHVSIANFRIPGTELLIPKGTKILSHIAGMHRDPKYFPEPEKFNPENFDELSQEEHQQ